MENAHGFQCPPAAEYSMAIPIPATADSRATRFQSISGNFIDTRSRW